MGELKWFTGGKERKIVSIELITELLKELESTPNSQLLQNVLLNYKADISQNGISRPLVMSQMNLAISKAMREDGIVLSDNQTRLLKELISLANIRYGS
ncbi:MULTISPECIES: bacteriocin immunity protein [Vagococcus]|uniref:bacteriocin immunity protein n=1 Tax=Vagococcus TaxID=2737 RepID=UPI002FC72D53